MDLTNSNKYYNGARDFAARGVEYLKIREPGHSEVPKRESVTRFCQAVSAFLRSNPQRYVAVHCTHGLNRTGFMIVSLLVDAMGYNLEAAVAAFAIARAPGAVCATHVCI